ncbi:unnamed protein product [Lactuca saligna]|uniref:Uncharacterized protein n=1 Tax=Lactuca saligna TaxID=75948 RepID=A0AA35YKS0_LACSI|nr:unnamed protein product [Lactuca saligna]
MHVLLSLWMLLFILRTLVGALLCEKLLVKKSGIPPPLLLLCVLAPSVLRGLGLSVKICFGSQIVQGFSWFSIMGQAGAFVYGPTFFDVHLSLYILVERSLDRREFPPVGEMLQVD